MTTISRSILLIKTSRPFFWLFIVVYLAGFYDSKAEISMPFIIQLLSYLFPIWLFANGINDIYDYESDKLNPKKTNPLIMPGTIFDSKYLSFIRESSAISRFIVFMTGSILEPEFHNFVKKSALFCGGFVFLVSLVTLNIINISLTGILLVFTYYYSAPPFRLKNYPPMDLVSILIGFLFLYINGYTFGNPTLTNVPLLAIVNITAWCMGVLGFITLANMMDYESDKQAGVKNSVVRFGMRRNAVFVFISWLIASLLVDLDFAPLMYYIYIMTAVYFSLIFHPTETYSKALFIFTMLSYVPVIVLYVISLAE